MSTWFFIRFRRGFRMRRASPPRFVFVCLLLGAFACGTSNTLLPVSREQAVSACVAFASCVPGDGVHACFQRQLNLFSPEEIRCLASAGSDCARVATCIGISVRSAPSDGGCGKSCEDGMLVTCSDSFRYKSDCTRWGARGDSCFASSLTAGCGIASCTQTRESCEGTKRVVCDLGVLTVNDCRNGGALTCQQNGNQTTCVGAGAACSDAEGATRCDGEVLVRCVGGREDRRDCRIGFEGGGCRVRSDSVDSSAFCGYDTGCRPKSGEEACSGDGGLKLTFCAGGQARTVDCVALGHRGCAGRACAPNIP